MAEVRQTFRASRIGTIAGCHVTQGKITRNAQDAAGARRHDRLRRHDRIAEALQGRRARGRGGLRVRHRARELPGRQGRRRASRRTRRARSSESSSSVAHGARVPFLVALTIHLHLPDNGSLKGKRKELLSVRAALHRRFGAASRRWTTRTCGSARRWPRGWSGGSAGELEHAADGIERYLLGRFPGRRAGRAAARLVRGPRRRERPGLQQLGEGSRARRRDVACIVETAGIVERCAGERRPADQTMPKRQDAPSQRGGARGLSMAITSDLKDPRVGFVTVTAVDTSPDLRHAHVYVSVLGDEQQREDSLAGLGSSHGYLQSRVAARAAAQAHAPARLPLRRQRRAGRCGSPSCCARPEEPEPMTLDTTTGREEVLAELRSGEKFLLTTHENPDGDALGSLVAMHEILRADGQGHRDVHVGRGVPAALRVPPPAARRRRATSCPPTRRSARSCSSTAATSTACRSASCARRRAHREHRPPPRQHPLRHREPGRRTARPAPPRSSAT